MTGRNILSPGQRILSPLDKSKSVKDIKGSRTGNNRSSYRIRNQNVTLDGGSTDLNELHLLRATGLPTDAGQDLFVLSDDG